MRFLSQPLTRGPELNFRIPKAVAVGARSLRRTNSRPRAADDATWAGARCTTQSAPVSRVARRWLCPRSEPRRARFPGLRPLRVRRNVLISIRGLRRKRERFGRTDAIPEMPIAPCPRVSGSHPDRTRYHRGRTPQGGYAVAESAQRESSRVDRARR